jgi:hypothetical protein
MNLLRHLMTSGTLSRPVRGEAGPWQYIGAGAAPRVNPDSYARRIPSRRSSLKVNAAGWRILLNVLRAR